MRKTKPEFICSNKRRFSDECAARAAAMLSIENRDIGALHIYKCKICKRWHLTKKRHARRFMVTMDNPWHEPMQPAQSQ